MVKSKNLTWKMWFATVITSIFIASCINWTIGWMKDVGSKVEHVEKQIEIIDPSFEKKVP